MRAALVLLLLAAAARAERVLDILEYRVEGVENLSNEEVERAVMPFLGPQRPIGDIELARAALEKAYSDKGYQSVTVAIPPQTVRQGVVVLKATEGKVGRLRVRGSRWFLPSEIKSEAPSLAEGAVPNFNDIVRDIVVLNQMPDRRVTPALRAGAVPGTIDVDLNVQDRLPLHGSVELNNRYSAGTTQQRLIGTLHYDNLWQKGHELSLSFQVAPRRTSDGEVFSGSYLARVTPWLSLTATGIVQNSDISTLGSTTVIGRGRIFGGRATFTLPSGADWFQTLSAGVDYKHFGKEIDSDPFSTPIVYWPLSIQYALAGELSLALSLVANLRGLGNGDDAFDARRYKATGSFFYLRGEASRTQELPRGLQLFARLQGQVATDPLLPSEQFAAGGAESVRGYVEAQAAGDSGLIGTLELRSPALWGDLRVHAFFDGGRVSQLDPLPEQSHVFFLWSAGAGARVRLFDRLAGSLDLAEPLRTEGATPRGRLRGHFRVQGEF
ncbi:MAG TPA: ShlB/FhaC/HecB family hemolysin secretion/activation protein [Myxococcales bacterium]|nr:ShlB/FhaC/HecB family hemolysin secretion/activation protein [Myxococcales bacterium]